MKSAKSMFSLSVGGFLLVGACSSSSSSGSSPEMAASTPPAPLDGGIPCGRQGDCAATEECCLADPTAPTCVAQGACKGSSLDCSTSKQCQNNQVCCFVYGSGDGGAAGRPFTAQCSDVCASGDSTHYQLCASTSECISGTCGPGLISQYCTVTSGGSPFPNLGGSDGG
jgi:hypothetical protein